MTAVLALAFALTVLTVTGVTAVLAARLVMPVSPCPRVAAWWRRRIVSVMLPVPGWSPA